MLDNCKRSPLRSRLTIIFNKKCMILHEVYLISQCFCTIPYFQSTMACNKICKQTSGLTQFTVTADRITLYISVYIFVNSASCRKRVIGIDPTYIFFLLKDRPPLAVHLLLFYTLGSSKQRNGSDLIRTTGYAFNPKWLKINISYYILYIILENLPSLSKKRHFVQHWD